LWTRFLWWLGYERPFPRTIDDLLQLWNPCVHQKMQRRVWVLFPYTILWSVWLARNDLFALMLRILGRVLPEGGCSKRIWIWIPGIANRGREIQGKVRTVLINALMKVRGVDLALKLMHSMIGIGVWNCWADDILFFLV
jgi:hypothetical protein